MITRIRNMRKEKFFALFLVSILSFFVVTFITYATSIGTNISVSGTLTSTGLSTLTGFVSTASSTVSNTLFTQDALYASSTLTVTGAVQLNSTFDVLGGGLSTLSGGFVSQASSTATGYFNALNLHASSTSAFDGLVTIGSDGFISQASSTVVGALTASDLYGSSTLAVTGAAQLFSTFDVLGGGLSTFSGGFISSASSTFGDASTDTNLFTGELKASSTLEATGNAILYGTLGVATTSISEGLGVDGDIAANSSGTTTIMLSSSGGTIGSCLQLEGASSSVTYRIYVGDRGDGTTLIAEVGSCQGTGEGN